MEVCSKLFTFPGACLDMMKWHEQVLDLFFVHKNKKRNFYLLQLLKCFEVDKNILGRPQTLVMADNENFIMNFSKKCMQHFQCI